RVRRLEQMKVKLARVCARRRRGGRIERRASPLIDGAAVVGKEGQHLLRELAGAEEHGVLDVGQEAAHGAAVRARAEALEMTRANLTRVGEQSLAETVQPVLFAPERREKRFELAHDLRLADH